MQLFNWVTETNKLSDMNKFNLRYCFPYLNKSVQQERNKSRIQF